MPNQGSVHAPHKPTVRFPSGRLRFHTGVAETFGRLVRCGAEPRPFDPTDILIAAPNLFVRPVARGPECSVVARLTRKPIVGSREP